MGVPVVTIDGPAGVGKTTLAQAIAARFGFALLASGTLYRLIGWYALAHGLLDDSRRLAEYARTLRGDWLNQAEALGDELRTEKVSDAASRIAAVAQLRSTLLSLQRDCARDSTITGLVAEGRDMGTVVFPDARHKFFVSASPESRALRRCLQTGQDPTAANLADIIGQIEARDRRDSTRQQSPLVPAGDSLVVDTSDMDINQSIRWVIDHIQATI